MVVLSILIWVFAVPILKAMIWKETVHCRVNCESKWLQSDLKSLIWNLWGLCSLRVNGNGCSLIWSGKPYLKCGCHVWINEQFYNFQSESAGATWKVGTSRVNWGGELLGVRQEFGEGGEREGWSKKLLKSKKIVFNVSSLRFVDFVKIGAHHCTDCWIINICNHLNRVVVVPCQCPWTITCLTI